MRAFFRGDRRRSLIGSAAPHEDSDLATPLARSDHPNHAMLEFGRLILRQPAPVLKKNYWSLAGKLREAQFKLSLGLVALSYHWLSRPFFFFEGGHLLTTGSRPDNGAMKSSYPIVKGDRIDLAELISLPHHWGRTNCCPHERQLAPLEGRHQPGLNKSANSNRNQPI